MRRALLLSNSAAAIVLLISVILASAAVLYAYRADEQRRAAGAASVRAQEELWLSYLAQARARRLNREAGSRNDALEAITKAAIIRPSLELRSEAAAALAIPGLKTSGELRAFPTNAENFAFSRDLEFCAFGGEAGTISIYRGDAQAPSETYVENGHVMSMAFAPNSRYLAVRYFDGLFCIWDRETQTKVLCIRYPNSGWRFHSHAFGGNGEIVSVADDQNKIHVHELPRGSKTATLSLEGAVRSHAWHPSGETLAIGIDAAVEFREPGDPKPRGRTPVRSYVEHLTWHPDGRRVAAGCRNGEVYLIDPNTRAAKQLSGHDGLVNGIRFSNDGRLMLSTSWDGTSKFWDAETGDFLFATQSGFGAQFSPDDKRVGYWKARLGVGIWEMSHAQGYRAFALPFGEKMVASASLIDRDQWLASASYPGVHLWNVSSGELLDFLPFKDARGVLLNPACAELFVTGPKGLFRATIEQTNGRVRIAEPKRIEKAPPNLDRIFVTPRSGWLASPGEDTVFLCELSDPESGKTLSRIGGGMTVTLTPNRKFLLNSFWKGWGTHVWDLTTRKRLLRLEPEGGTVMCNASGEMVVTGTRKEYTAWEVGSWKPRWRVERSSASEQPGILAFSSDNTLLAIVQDLRRVLLLEPSSGETLLALESPAPEFIRWLAFSENGTRLVAGTDNGQLQVWDLSALQTELQALNLDWSQTISASAAMATGTTWIAPVTMLWLCLISGAGIAILGFLTIAYHRRMAAGYMRVEQLAAERATKLRSAQEEVLQSQKMRALGTFAAGIAHDFNNLLSVIRMSNQFIRRSVDPNPTVVEEIECIENAVQKGRSVVRSMLGFSRPASDELEQHSIRDVIENTLALFNQQFLGKVTPSLDCPAAIPPLWMRRNRIEQILLNLVMNAVEAMKGQGSLRLSVESVEEPPHSNIVLKPAPADNYVVITVSDSGPGISPEVLPRIFEPFFTTKNKRHIAGTGLGLSTVYTIAEQEGLGLRVFTELGKGSSFSVILPAETKRPATAAEELTDDPIVKG